jgi:hypothetical protein
MLNLLLGPVSSIAKDVIGGYVQTKKAKAEQKVTEIKAKTELLNKQIKGEIDYDMQALQNSSGEWKDEAWTILFIIIIAGCFIPPFQPWVKEGFRNLSETPQWFQFAMYGAIGSSFGLRSMTKFLKK